MNGKDESASRGAVKIKLLIMVAMADGRWDEREVAMLESLADTLGIDRAELSRIRDEPNLDVAELSAGLPGNNTERIGMLADLIKMAYADRKLHESEMKLLIKLGTVLGFDEDTVTAIVEDEG